MGQYVINANGFGAYYVNVGGAAVDDTVTVNIGVGFGGTVTVDSLPADGGIETVITNLPDGWTLQLTGEVVHTNEDPPMLDRSYSVFNAASAPVGTLSVRANVFDIPCFCKGTVLVGESGRLIRVEELRVGDLLQTIDGKLCPVRWIDVNTLSSRLLKSEERLRPIKICAGALGPGVPFTDLFVSPQHRILVESRIVKRMLGVTHTLVAAKKLLGLEGVEICSAQHDITYYHVLFDAHEVIVANGAAAESLFLGPQAKKSLSSAALKEIGDIIPEIAEWPLASTVEPAALMSSGKQAKKLIERHIRNDVPIYQNNYLGSGAAMGAC